MFSHSLETLPEAMTQQLFHAIEENDAVHGFVLRDRLRDLRSFLEAIYDGKPPQSLPQWPGVGEL